MGNRQSNVNIRKIKNSLTALFQCIFWEFLWKQNVLNNKAHKFLELKYNFITYILYITMNKIKEGAKNTHVMNAGILHIMTNMRKIM